MGKDGSRRAIEGTCLLSEALNEAVSVLAPVAAPAVEPRRQTIFGRSRGKRLREYHARLVRELLPRFEVGRADLADPGGLFPAPTREFWLEIGFGGGEHLVREATTRPNIGFVGCEPFVNGVAKLLANIDRLSLSNVRIHSGDAGVLVASMPDHFVSRAFCLYPDPWPKRRHNKRRIISAEFIDNLGRVMRPGAQLLFATDVDDYCGWALQRFLDSTAFSWQSRLSSDWLKPWPGWRPTRYEAKAQREGRTSSYLTFWRV